MFYSNYSSTEIYFQNGPNHRDCDQRVTTVVGFFSTKVQGQNHQKLGFRFTTPLNRQSSKPHDGDAVLLQTTCKRTACSSVLAFMSNHHKTAILQRLDSGGSEAPLIYFTHFYMPQMSSTKSNFAAHFPAGLVVELLISKRIQSRLYKSLLYILSKV